MIAGLVLFVSDKLPSCCATITDFWYSGDHFEIIGKNILVAWYVSVFINGSGGAPNPGPV